MPAGLKEVLARLGAVAGPGEFAAVERLLGGSFAGLDGLRRDPVARLDASGLGDGQIWEWLESPPGGPDAGLLVAWAADRAGPRMSLGALAAGIGDLLHPAADDIVAVLDAGGRLMVLVLDHEEVFTLSGLPAAEGGFAIEFLPSPGKDEDGNQVCEWTTSMGALRAFSLCLGLRAGEGSR